MASPAQQRRQAEADAGGARGRRRRCVVSSRVGGRRPVAAGRRSPRRRPARARPRSGRRRRASARRALRQPGDSRRRASTPVSHGTTVAGSSSADSRIRPAAGSIHHMSADGRAPTSDRDRERRDHPQHHVLQRVDVVRRCGPAGRRGGTPAGRRAPGARAARRRCTRRSASTRNAASWPTSRSP